ncbi:hypothetical protein [Psychrobacter sp. M13]|uniref:hypothetical protein n=1 Tax=Psychrobacter sp. M13 TaxID=3067275 RepID=UPI00273B3074|nr:hypothetical protein [Psychrobacter sp. M13]WLP95288.1 hypothetical protein Q9G97_04055 [Psychrobacter sp. M13]
MTHDISRRFSLSVLMSRVMVDDFNHTTHATSINKGVLSCINVGGTSYSYAVYITRVIDKTNFRPISISAFGNGGIEVVEGVLVVNTIS